MSKDQSLARRLSDGLYGRLEFDFACNRGHAFGEAHLQGVLMEILASNVDPRTTNVEPSYAVDTIQRAECEGEDGKKVSGRKREVDFAVLTRPQLPDKPELLTCIEAKWAGSSHAKPENVLLDLTRLALISQDHPGATCLFLLAGGKDDVTKLLGVRMPKISKTLGAKPLWPDYDGKQHKYNVRNAPGRHGALDMRRLGLLSEAFQRVPVQLRTFMYKPSHEVPPNWRVHVWRVSAPPLLRSAEG